MSRTVVMNNRFVPSDFLPIGFLGYLPYAAVPAGWLVCDGAVYNIADYPELAAKLGNTYGGDGVTMFAVPDDRGLFRRGLDLSKGYDVGRALGSEQDQDVQPHKHRYGPYASVLGGSSSGYSLMAGSSYLNTLDSTGTETRPKNRAYVPIIKAKNIYYDLTIQGGNAASLGGNPASYYAANSLVAKYTDFTGSFAVSGYRKLPDGTIIQWGTSTGGATFPIAFPNACFCVVPQCFVNSSSAIASMYNAVTAKTTTSFTMGGSGNTLAWIAIGY